MLDKICEKEKKSSIEPHWMQEVLPAACATVIAECCTLPICTIKTNYQTNDPKIPLRRIIQGIYEQWGWKGFYHASFWAITSQVVSTASKYVLYRQFQGYGGCHPPSTFQRNLVCGAMAGAVSTCLTHPLDFCKLHMQKKKCPIAAIRQEGVQVLLRGSQASLVKATLGTPLWFPIYDLYLPYVSSPLTAAFLTAVTATSILHPIDYAKTRKVHGKNWKVTQCFTGFTLNLSRCLPHFCIQMSLIESFHVHK